MKKKPHISLFFPVYNDEKTVRRVTLKSLKVLSELADNYEVIIINDGSPDDSGVIADGLSKEFPEVRVIHHEQNKGYGAAIKTGLSNAKFDWILFTDGDDEYDVFDLYKFIKLLDHYKLIITFRYVRLYSNRRVFISRVYNAIFRFLFKTQFRDISTGLRMIHRDVVESIDLVSNSPFIGAELTVKTMLKGFPVGEVGIQTFPREFGQGASTSFKNIKATVVDMLSIRRTIFSQDYDLPINRKREFIKEKATV